MLPNRVALSTHLTRSWKPFQSDIRRVAGLHDGKCKFVLVTRAESKLRTCRTVFARTCFKHFRQDFRLWSNCSRERNLNSVRFSHRVIFGSCRFDRFDSDCHDLFLEGGERVGRDKYFFIKEDRTKELLCFHISIN